MPDREQTTLRLPVELLDELRREARERGISLNERISDLIQKGYRFEEMQ